MTDKQILVLNKIVETCQAVTGIVYAGLYPDNKHDIGQNFPAVLVEDGNESAPTYNAGQEVIYDYQVTIRLYHELRLTNRIQDILSLQNKLLTAIITDLSLSGLVQIITGHSVDKGISYDDLPEGGAGYQSEITARNININMKIKDTRQ